MPWPSVTASHADVQTQGFHVMVCGSSYLRVLTVASVSAILDYMFDYWPVAASIGFRGVFSIFF